MMLAMQWSLFVRSLCALNCVNESGHCCDSTASLDREQGRLSSRRVLLIKGCLHIQRRVQKKGRMRKGLKREKSLRAYLRVSSVGEEMILNRFSCVLANKTMASEIERDVVETARTVQMKYQSHADGDRQGVTQP